MGVVYRATDLRLRRPVALKLIAPEFSGDEGFRKRFERESQTAAMIRHPHVITIFQAGEQDGSLYITMGYVVLSIAVSSIVGVVSGWYPASRAAKLDPVVALRAE